jgi:catalase
LFDAVVIATSVDGVAALARPAAALEWVREAFGHLKVIGYAPEGRLLLEQAGIEPDVGVIELDVQGGATTFIELAKRGRIWTRSTAFRCGCDHG